GVDRARPVVGGPCEPRHQPPAHRAHAAVLSLLDDDQQVLARTEVPPRAGVDGRRRLRAELRREHLGGTRPPDAPPHPPRITEAGRPPPRPPPPPPPPPAPPL